MKSRRENQRINWLIGLPPILFLSVFFLAPMFFVWLMSFGETQDLITITVTGTLDNYLQALNPLYLAIIWKSLWIGAATTLACLALAFPVALLIAQTSAPNKPWLLLLVMLPFWTNMLVRTYALIAILRRNGQVNFVAEWTWQQSNQILKAFGLGHQNLIGERYVPFDMLYNDFAVILGLVYIHLPFMVLPLYAALERMDRSQIEASIDLGANRWSTLRTIIIPLARPGILAGILITFIPAMGAFLIPELLGGPNSQLIGNVIERQFKSAINWPLGAALSFLLMYITFILLALRYVSFERFPPFRRQILGRGGS